MLALFKVILGIVGSFYLRPGEPKRFCEGRAKSDTNTSDGPESFQCFTLSELCEPQVDHLNRKTG